MNASRCAIAVMAKAPRAGAVKTRLVPPLTPDEATLASASFLRDVTENVRRAGHVAPIDGYVAYAPASLEALFDGMLAPGTRLVLADGTDGIAPGVDGFGRCLLQATRALFAAGHPSVCLLNSDSPNLPTALLAAAARALAEPGDRVVLGPAEDGGYYLIGMTAPHPRLFADIAWSTPHVAEATRRRAREIGLDIVELARWYDVDDLSGLQRLLREVADDARADDLRADDAGADDAARDRPLHPFAAPATVACLRRLGLFQRLTMKAAE